MFKSPKVDAFRKEVRRSNTPAQNLFEAYSDSGTYSFDRGLVQKKKEDLIAARFMGLVSQLTLSSVLNSVNDAYGKQNNFSSIKACQSKIVELRQAVQHDEANNLEIILDEACLIKQKKNTTKGISSYADACSEVTRETADTESCLEDSSFCLRYLPPTDRSERLDLAWLRQFYEEDDSRRTLSRSDFDVYCGSEATDVYLGVGLYKHLREKKRQIKDIARKCSWTSYDVYNAQLVTEFLENRLPNRQKEHFFSKIIKRTKSFPKCK